MPLLIPPPENKQISIKYYIFHKIVNESKKWVIYKKKNNNNKDVRKKDKFVCWKSKVHLH